MSLTPSPRIAALMSRGGRAPNSQREIRIIDTTLRDGHQSLWATRMRTDHIVGMAADFDQAGFEQVDLVAPIQFDVAAGAAGA
jgi:oxaloacetate decarboxylase alpha subunit